MHPRIQFRKELLELQKLFKNSTLKYRKMFCDKFSRLILVDRKGYEIAFIDTYDIENIEHTFLKFTSNYPQYKDYNKVVKIPLKQG